MQSLKKYRDKAKGVPDLLNWAALVDDGIIQCKDGALLVGYRYRSEDIASCTDNELNYITERINHALSQFGSGWVSWIDMIRLPSPGYPLPKRSYFPDPISQLIDNERRAFFERRGNHYESQYVLILQYMPPHHQESRITEMMYNDDHNDKKNIASNIIEYIKKTLIKIEDILLQVIKIRRMGSYFLSDPDGSVHLYDDLVDYLDYCLTGTVRHLKIPSCPMYMDAYIGGKELYFGNTPLIGEKYVSVVAIEGYPHESWPGILDILNHLSLEYRWSTRFIYIDQHEAIAILKRMRSKWRQRITGFFSQMFKTKTGIINEDALLMSQESEAAMNDAQANIVTYGYYTNVVVVMHEDLEFLLEQSRFINRSIDALGFASRIETINTMEAWIGSIPGHTVQNVRRPLNHTLHVADLMPLSSVWPGLDANPCEFYPKNAPPLMYVETTGSTPFRLNLHVDDVGHTVILGPTGSGKSTALGIIAAQFRRYLSAHVVWFDMGGSAIPITLGMGGTYYNIGSNKDGPSYCPLHCIDNDEDRAWAAEWLETCYELQTEKSLSPNQKMAINHALHLMSSSTSARSLTHFCRTVQDHAIRVALNHYTINGDMGYLLDAENDALQNNNFIVHEVETLLTLNDKNVLPVLLYLFRHFQRSLKGQPALLILDEAWIFLGHPLFQKKLKEWLKTLRRYNCAVVLATQSITDLVNSGIMDIILESCQTKIYLANTEALLKGTREVPGPYDYYKMFGLNDIEINIIEKAQRKKDYYYVSPLGRRLFSFALGPVALSFVGVSDKASLKKIQEMAAEYGSDWTYRWLEKNNIEYSAYI